MKKPSALWTIDPYLGNARAWKRSRELAHSIDKALSWPLCPVYVADRSPDSPFRGSREDEVKRFIDRSEKRLNRLLKPLSDLKLVKAQVLFSNDSSFEGEVQLLNKYAKKHASSFMIAATTARRGLERFVQGSFAESLVEYATTPVILVNPDCRPLKTIKHIVFATDFSPQSRKAFQKICHFAKSAKASLQIASVLSDELSWMNPGFADLPAREVLKRTLRLEAKKKRVLRLAAKWIQTARKNGIKCTAQIYDKPLIPVATALLEVAQESGADLFALAARGDTSNSHLFGNTTQNIIRNCLVPIWISPTPKARTFRRNRDV